MTPPENDRPDDEDGGTFKLKPGAGAQPPPAPQGGEEEGLDRTMKIQRQPGTPPPPPSPLGNPTGPSEPANAPYAETTVMPQSGPQTGYQPPAAQQPPMGSGQMPPAPGQQPYGQQPGQQPGAYPPPPQQGGYPQAQAGPATGEAPSSVKQLGLMAMIGAGIGLISAIFSFMSGPLGAFSGVIALLIAGAMGWYGFALPRGQVTSAGLRLTGVILMMIGAGFAIIGLFGSFAAFTLLGGIAAFSLILNLASAGAYGYASFLYLSKDEVKAYIKGAPAGMAYPPAGQPGYPPQPGYPQQGGYPPQPQQPYGQQPPAPGQQPGYPPPPPGHPQQGQQPPYGG